MKKTLVTMVALAATLLSLSVSAQEKDQVLVPSNSRWFIGVGGGVNFVFDNLKFSSPAPAGQLYFGKWFTPAIGFRAGYSGVQAKAAAATDTWFAGDKAFFNHYAHIDALWNVRNTYGYKEDIIWNPVLYLQAGGLLAHQDKNRCWAFGLGAGFQNLFRVSKRVSLSIDLSAVVAPERPYRNYTGGRFVIFPTATAGLVVDLGKAFQRPVKVEVPDPEIIDKLSAKLASANDNLANVESRAAALAKKAAKLDKLQEGKLYEFTGGNLNEAQPIVAAASATPEILYFELGKTKLDPRELARLEYYAQKTFKHDQKLLITGGADLGTGSLETNKRLSKQRAEYVKNILVNQFGYNAANITTDADVIPSDSPIKGRIVTIEVQ